MCNDLFITFYSLKHVFFSFTIKDHTVATWQSGVIILSFSVQDEHLETQRSLLSHQPQTDCLEI